MDLQEAAARVVALATPRDTPRAEREDVRVRLRETDDVAEDTIELWGPEGAEE